MRPPSLHDRSSCVPRSRDRKKRAAVAAGAQDRRQHERELEPVRLVHHALHPLVVRPHAGLEVDPEAGREQQIAKVRREEQQQPRPRGAGGRIGEREQRPEEERDLDGRLRARNAIGTVTDGSWRCAGPPGWISMRGWSRKANRLQLREAGPASGNQTARRRRQSPERWREGRGESGVAATAGARASGGSPERPRHARVPVRGRSPGNGGGRKE